MDDSDEGAGHRRSDSARPEDEHARLARNLNELLQELRVAQAGVQILFAFLLSVAFTTTFQQTGTYVHVLHLVTVLLAAGASLTLTAPAAWHRVLFQQRRRPDIVQVGNRLSLIGLGLLAAAMAGTVLLIGEVVVGGWQAKLIGVATAAGFAIVWFVLPGRRRDW